MGLFNLSPAVGLLSNVTITVRRHAPDSYDEHGRAVTRTFATLGPLRASMQPIKGSDLLKLPEGERDSSWQTIYAPIALQDGDVIAAPDASYQVRSLGDWMTLGAFSRVFIRRMGEQEPRA